jgi:ADP-heptose:LPS heptosyltransferase
VRVLIIRYGGFGDALQAASILPHLKSAGVHITMDLSEQGAEVLKHDPCIDQVLITPRGSVAAADLPRYWEARANGFDRVINLTESVECSLLTTPNRLEFYHDDAARRRLFSDRSYLEHIHCIAGVPGPFVPRYCLSQEERAGAQPLSSERTIVIALAGSAEYKVWPLTRVFAARALRRFDRIFLAGGEQDAALAREVIEFCDDADQDSEGRIFDMTLWPIRDTLAVACAADAVVGPETGVLNAVAGYANRKVVLLSHSSARNLTAHWRNTVAIAPAVPCHPCHRLHQTTKFCPRGPSGQFAACTESIHPDQVIEALGDLT